MYKKSDQQPLISVIVPGYNTANTLHLPINSLLSQTYKNLEIIIVNDGSSDSTQEIARSYAKKDSRVKVLSHEKNRGLFQARLTGADAATGDYIAFLDGDDTVSVDYYRTMLATAMHNQSDMVLAEVVWDDIGLKKKIVSTLANDLPFQSLSGNDAFDSFMEQHGTNHNWHVAWNKLISKDLWNKARPHYNLIKNHLVMTEDISISIPLWYFAKQVDRSSTSYNFYRRGDVNQSTAVTSLTREKVLKNIDDIVTTFYFFDEFLRAFSLSDKYKTILALWKELYVRFWHDNIAATTLPKEDKTSLLKRLESLHDYSKEATDINTHMFDISADWNDGLERIKRAMLSDSIRVISFDMFDTLVVRPFETPSDMFKLLDDELRALDNKFTLLSFHDIRLQAEQDTRLSLKHLEDITLDDIYTTIIASYGIEASVANALKSKELELEKKFNIRRNTAYELYELAKHLGKKVAITTDMYLPRQTLEAILTQNGYIDWDELFISSEINKSKHTGTIYEHIHNQFLIKPDQILHIGDNDHADIAMAKKYSIRAMYFPKTTEAMRLNNNVYKVFENIGDSINAWPGRWHFGIRSFLAVIANRYFDNPFSSQPPHSLFNGTISMMGYAALGMHMYAVADWIDKEVSTKKYDNLLFLARDGRLPMAALALLSSAHKSTRISYLPNSRKANIPLSIESPDDLWHLNKFVNLERHNLGYILDILDSILDKKMTEKHLASSGHTRSTKLSSLPYGELVSLLKRMLSESKITDLRQAFINTYGDSFSGKVAVFDVGYSAKPEQIFSRLFDKDIHTYFIHANEEGSERALVSKSITMEVFYDYFPSLGSELRELCMSELAPSCVGYDVIKDKVSPTYDRKFQPSYYERLLVTSLQTNALQFVQDITSIFGEYRHRLTYTNQYASLLFESIMLPISGPDKEIFAPLAFEDDILAGTRDIRSNHHENIKPMDVLLQGKSKLIKALALALLDRGEFKHKVDIKTKQHSILNIGLRKSYSSLRTIVRSIKKSP